MESNNYPTSWILARLESVCEILDAKRIPVNNTERNERIAGKDEAELFPYYGATGQVGWIDDFIFEGEHVLVGEDGAPFLDPIKQKAYIATGKFWVNNHAHILLANFSNKYLCHYLNIFNYSEFVTGTTRLKLNQALLKNIPVPIPPLNEQKRIVAKIEELFSELDNGIAALKTAREQLKAYRQVVLKHAFEGKLTAKWRENNADKLESPEQLLARIQQEREARYQQQLDEWKAAIKAWEVNGKEGKKPGKPTLPKDSELNTDLAQTILWELPLSWQWIKLSELLQNSPQNGIYKPASDYGSGCQIIRIDNFYDGSIVNAEKLKRLSVSDDEIATYGLQAGNLIVNRVNSIEYLGKSALVRQLNEPTVFESNVMRCSLIARLVSNEYVTLYLNSASGRKELCKNAKHAVNQASINQTDVGNTFVPLCTMEEQELIAQEISRRFDIVDRTLTDIDLQLHKAETLRQSILQKAFSGQLIPQDANDEPASELLARIQAEKEATKTKNTNKTRKAK